VKKARAERHSARDLRVLLECPGQLEEFEQTLATFSILRMTR